MEIKYSRLRCKSAVVAGLLLCGNSFYGIEVTLVPDTPTYLQLEFPPLSTIPDRAKFDQCIAIGSNIAKLSQGQDLLTSFTSGKSFSVNQKGIVGFRIPIICLAACLPTVDVLKKFIENDETIVNPETSLGNTPMHFAAANSPVCLAALIADGRLNVNEHNYNGETPLYIAMKYNFSQTTGLPDSNAQAVDALLGCSRIRVNSTDEKGRTALHIAVMHGDTNVVRQLFKLSGKYGDDGHEFKMNIKDYNDFTAADYLGNNKDASVREQLTGYLLNMGAEYGNGSRVEL
jgi:ankyrin repeat protein